MASVVLKDCKLQIRTKVGELSSGANQVKSISLTGANQAAEAAELMGVSDAIASIINYPVLETLRVDTQLVEAE